MDKQRQKQGLIRDLALIGTVWIALFGGFAVLYGTKRLLQFDVVPGVDMLNDDLQRRLD